MFCKGSTKNRNRSSNSSGHRNLSSRKSKNDNNSTSIHTNNIHIMSRCRFQRVLESGVQCIRVYTGPEAYILNSDL